MSNIPPPPDGLSDRGLVPAYDSAPRYNRLAQLAMILGIIAVPTSVVLVGIPLGLAALVLGIIARVRIGRNPYLGGLGMAKVGTTLGIVGGVVIPLACAVLMPSLSSTRYAGGRDQCSANLHGIMQSMILYAAESATGGGGTLPCVVPTTAWKYQATNALLTHGKPTAAAALADMQSGTCASVAGSPTAGLWMLVLRGQTPPKNYICRSDSSPSLIAATVSNAAGAFYEDFTGSNISYAVSFPWNGTSGAGAWYKDNTDSTCPYVADMPPGAGQTFAGVSSDVASASTPGAIGAAINSPNHDGAGQHVAFGDVHVEWKPNPACGTTPAAYALAGQGDNIFTSSAKGPDAGGTNPTAGGVSPIITTTAPFDIVMVPARLATGGTQ